jgi:putative ABC transport system substrate-binding protein
MNRRAFVSSTGCTLLVWPLAARIEAAEKTYRVGLIYSVGSVTTMMGPDRTNPYVRTFLHALRDLGYVEGRNLIFQPRSAEGRGPKRVGEIGAEFIRAGIDVIVLASTLDAKEMKRVTSTVPIVMATSVDPVGRGVIASLARPGGNVTGLMTQIGSEHEGKRLQLLKEAFPEITRVAFLGLKSDLEAPSGHATQVAASTLGLTLVHVEHSRTDYTEAFSHMAREPPDALFVSIQPASYNKRQLIFDFARKHGLPASYPWREFVVDGGLMSYGPSISDLFRRAAGYVDKILKGAAPADLPVEQATKFELVINLRTAKDLGLTVPPTLLAIADEVIE